MENADIAIYVAYFWYGVSLVLYLSALVRKGKNTVKTISKVKALFLTILGLVGAFGLVFLAGGYNQAEEYSTLIILAGGLAGFIASKILFGTNTESSKK